MKISNKKLNVVVLGLILIASLFWRVYKNDQIPAGFFCDEASIGYNAYSLTTTGADEYGRRWPFFFQAFGDYRNPVPIYANIPSVAVFGLNEFSVRFTTALAGALGIGTAYLLLSNLFGQPVGLFASFFLAISPWHLHYSRFGSEYIFFPFWYTLALWLFLVGLKKKRWLPVSALAFGITLYTYYPAWLVVPVTVAGLAVIYRNEVSKNLKQFFIFGLIFLGTLIPLVVGIKEGAALTRWRQVSVFKQEAAIKTDTIVTTKRLWDTYWSHFSPEFLFLKGDIDYPGHFITRFSVRGWGELYWFQLPLFLVGLIWIFANVRRPSSQLLLLWLAVYPLGSTLIGTDGGGPFAFRSIIGVVPFQVVTGIGVIELAEFFNKKFGRYMFILTTSIALVTSLFFFAKYLRSYFNEYPLYSSDFWGWQYGAEQVMAYFLEEKNNYDGLYLMGDFNAPEIFPKFYDPENQCRGLCQIGGLEKLSPSLRQLYAISQPRLGEIPPDLRLETKETIYYPNGSPAYQIGELKKR